MTKEEALEQLIELREVDEESAHIAADMILTDLLTSLGCEEVVAEFISMPKWYS